MSQAKSDKPAVTTYGNHEVISLPNKLRSVMSFVESPDAADDPIARAEQALAALSSEFSTWMDLECERLDVARRKIREVGFTKATREALFHAAHDIKGEAATFGYPAVASVGRCGARDRTRECARRRGGNRSRPDQPAAGGHRGFSAPREPASAGLSRKRCRTLAGAGRDHGLTS
jgi:hypothetical protein